MKDKIRAGLVIPDLHIGGAERLIVDMVSYWQRKGEPIEPYVYSFRGGPIREELDAQSVHVFLPPEGPRINPLIIPWLIRSFRRDGIQLVHLHLPRPGFYGRVAANLLRIPVLYTEHNLWEIYNSLSRFLNGCTYSLNTRVVTVSDAVMASVRRHSRYPAARLSRIYNGISASRDNTPENRPHLRREMGLPDDAMMVGTIANLHPRKGLKYLLLAVSHLLDDFSNLHCVIVGRDDGEEAALRRIAGELGIEGRVHWLGYRPDARTLLPTFDIFVLPSLVEGLPVALIEAMDAALPIVATEVGGNSEIVEDGVTGLLVPKECPDALADALRALLVDPTRRHEMGLKGMERMRSLFTIERMASQYAQLYRSILSR